MSTTLAEKHAPTRMQWSKALYHQLGELDVFRDKRVELIRGEIYDMSPMGSDHWLVTNLISDKLRHLIDSSRFFVTDQCPIDLDADSEPEPDVAVIPGEIRSYQKAKPGMAALIVEVADSSLAFDRAVKLPLYAAAGVPECWIVDIRGRRIEVYRDPVVFDSAARRGRYVVNHIASESDEIAAHFDASVRFAVQDVLPVLT